MGSANRTNINFTSHMIYASKRLAPCSCALCFGQANASCTAWDNVGTVPAALTTYLAVQRFSPDLIISMGTAGGFRARGGAIGDVYVGSSFMNHDRRIPIPVCPARSMQSASHSTLSAPVKCLAVNAKANLRLAVARSNAWLSRSVGFDVRVLPSVWGCMQGFDKYGIGKYEAVQTPNLIRELGLKVRSILRFCPVAPLHGVV